MHALPRGAPSRLARWDLSALLAAILLATTVVTPSGASAQSPDQVADPWEHARTLYREGAYERAVPFAIEAVQRQPDRGDLYLGLARVLFRAERYDESVYYYDLYLNQFAAEGDGDRERVVRERGSANGLRSDPESEASPPRTQDVAREALAERLSTGPILTPNRGGAYSLYRTLLRTGYARPDLQLVRSRLAEALIDEADQVFDVTRAAIPAMRLEQWEAQRDRYRLALQLSGVDPDTLGETERPETDGTTGTPASDQGEGTATADRDEAVVEPAPRLVLSERTVEATRLEGAARLCEGQLQFLNLNHDAALERFHSALVLDADLLPAWMGALNANERLGRLVTEAAARDLQGLADAIDRLRPDAADVVALYRALTADRQGLAEESAAVVWDLVRTPPDAR